MIEVVEEEVQEDDEEDTDGKLAKPTTDEIRKAVDTLVKFLARVLLCNYSKETSKNWILPLRCSCERK